ncbi:putative quinol monooxygenase [Chelativorans salis]|uniref:Antibiotic biosynthesis monooxygenase n=1 Tax=Chelativorans salis TaxID=2978478 RepID=A0ABT2LMU3_9HYPH|nr:antibiotic biosynthesis monooxygenase [Chelativorans sp. EGI FJ00035]MCT7375833.1 antibiotic biosynthesis monooxygenase [Chelativorans sp. EGI FJ00035]
MIVEYIRYVLKDHSPEELRKAYEEAGAHLRAAPECLGYELAQCDEEASNVTLRILWTSVEAHMKGFRTGPNFPPFLALIRPFIGEIAEMRHYTPTTVVWDRSA